MNRGAKKKRVKYSGIGKITTPRPANDANPAKNATRTHVKKKKKDHHFSAIS
jgi:hypothetical protein